MSVTLPQPLVAHQAVSNPPKPATDAEQHTSSAAKPSRRPLTPPQILKLRDADIVVLEDRCKGCSFCIEFCPRDVLEQGTELNIRGVHVPRVRDSALCVGCGVCEEVCPDFAIFLVEKGKRH